MKFPFEFEKEQRVYTIGSMKVGGQPGQRPPVLIGSMFHKGDALISERKGAKFNRDKAREYLKLQEELSRETGIPSMVDVVANSIDEAKAYMDFLVETTSLPMAIDSFRLEVKQEAMRHAGQLDILSKTVYNSLNPWSKDMKREVEALIELGVKHLILMVYSDSDPSSLGRLSSLEALLKAIEDAPFESILVDTSVMNLPALGISLLANYRIKEAHGLPCGCSPANATYGWKGARRIWGEKGFEAVDASAMALASLLFCDFILYGPMVAARRAFASTVTAMAILPMLLWDGRKEVSLEAEHPLSKLFPDIMEQWKTMKGSQS